MTDPLWQFAIFMPAGLSFLFLGLIFLFSPREIGYGSVIVVLFVGLLAMLVSSNTQIQTYYDGETLRAMVDHLGDAVRMQGILLCVVSVIMFLTFMAVDACRAVAKLISWEKRTKTLVPDSQYELFRSSRG